MKSILRKKRGAIELSMTTIVVVVLSLTLLIMGFVLVRSIMCGAIGISGNIADYSRKIIDDLFSASSGEVQCVGDGISVSISTGKSSQIPCRFDATSQNYYRAEVRIDKDASTILNRGVSEQELRRWLIVNTWNGEIPPNDKSIKPIAKLDIPENSPEGDIALEVKFFKGRGSSETLLTEKILTFTPKQEGAIKGFLC